jgi:hypothetical protein
VVVRGHLLLLVMVVGKELVVVFQGVHSQLLVMVGDRPLMPLFMGRGLQLVVLQKM